MAVKRKLNWLWETKRISKLRIVSKRKLSEWKDAREVVRGEERERMHLDEANATLAGMGLGASNAQHHYEDDGDIDPRFIENPNGEGCSKTFENPSFTETTDSETLTSTPTSTSPRASRDDPECLKEHFPMAIKEREPVFDPSTWLGPESLRIDWAKGKRKGRATFDEGEELRLMKEWLAQVEAGKIRPEEGWTRKRIIAVMRGRAWTY